MVFPKMASWSIPALWLVLPCTLPRMTTRSHVTNKSSVDPWYQGGTEKQARPFPEPRLGQSSPLSRGYIPSRLSLFCTSTNGQEQGVPPRSLEPPTMYPSPAGRTQGQARQDFCPHRQVDEKLIIMSPVLGVFACGLESLLILLLKAFSVREYLIVL